MTPARADRLAQHEGRRDGGALLAVVVLATATAAPCTATGSDQAFYIHVVTRASTRPPFPRRRAHRGPGRLILADEARACWFARPAPRSTPCPRRLPASLSHLFRPAAIGRRLYATPDDLCAHSWHSPSAITSPARAPTRSSRTSSAHAGLGIGRWRSPAPLHAAPARVVLWRLPRPSQHYRQGFACSWGARSSSASRGGAVSHSRRAPGDRRRRLGDAGRSPARPLVVMDTSGCRRGLEGLALRDRVATVGMGDQPRHARRSTCGRRRSVTR